MDSQRQLGTELLAAIETAVLGGASSFTVLPATYRINSSIALLSLNQFTLSAAGADIIVEAQVPHFLVENCTNLSITCPLTLDSNPFGGTQGVIVGTDLASYIDLQVMDGCASRSATKFRWSVELCKECTNPLSDIITSAMTA